MVRLTLLLACAPASAFDGHQVTEGDLTALIEELGPITERNVDVPVRVTLTNAGEGPISGTVSIRRMIDDTRVVGPDTRPFEVAGGAQAHADFAVAFGDETYSARYPIHAFVDFRHGGRRTEIHAVRIVLTRFAQPPNAGGLDAPIIVPDAGALPLWSTGRHRPSSVRTEAPTVELPIGWMGMDPESNMHLAIQPVTRGDARDAIMMHPPWDPIGSAVAVYQVALPDTAPIRLSFANAIRSTAPDEPESDGVRFKVFVGDDLLFERFTDSTTWVDGEADLSAYAGREVALALSSDPGPNDHPYCDGSYWAEPTIIVGQTPTVERRPLDDTAAENERRGRGILDGDEEPDGLRTFVVGEGTNRTAIILSPSERGIVDGVLSFVGNSGAVSFEGLRVDILKQPVMRRPYAVEVVGYEASRQGDRAVHTHHLRVAGEPVDLTLTFRTEGDGLRMSFDCPLRITDLALGPADRLADSVYYGHGYRIDEPRAFTANFGGHDLSTSHVGADYSGGLSMLQAVDVPPVNFRVDPDSREYSLHTRLNGTMTLVAGETGALDCAIRYRPLYDKKPAGAVERLAGRMCLDIWGGQYGDIADSMEELIRYGVTDSLLTVHVWQRWGYDYRLPDVWPPDARLGTIADMRRIGEVCKPRDIPWGLHDDYVCIFPDATDFSYDLVTFSEGGVPLEHWYTESRDAQSYGFRPDKFLPFVRRNIPKMKRGVAPTHMFLDVFTSQGMTEYWDRDGNYHSPLETRKWWGESFRYIRDTLGNAPTTSEAGHDQLIGWLDGADCQHLTLTDEHRRFWLRRPCADWERVPWFDAVNHHRFALHGVGYSSRYQGGRDRTDHGINSDDYLSAEVLQGHALMVDQWCWGMPAVRKYWLAQDIARNLALRKIAATEFVDGDMHRMRVTWDNGTIVHVNRGEANWTVDGHVLPQYGYLVQGEGLASSVELRDGIHSESTVTPGTWYCNARTHVPDRRYAITPRLEGFEDLGGGKFAYDIVWDAREAAPRDLRVYVHFYDASDDEIDVIPFQDDHDPPEPTGSWAGEVRYRRTVTVPDDVEGDFNFAAGLYDAEGVLRLKGPLPPVAIHTPIWLGTVKVSRDAEGEASISLTPPPQPETVEPERCNPTRRPINFGFAVTDGAFRLERTEKGLVLTPLPGHPAFTATLRLDRLGSEGRDENEVTVECDGESLEYEVVVE